MNDDMGTPGPNHPAWRGLGKRNESQFKDDSNVVDLNAERKKRRIDRADEAYYSNKKALWDEDK